MKAPRTLADLFNDPRVESIWQEGPDEMGDGRIWWWLELSDGYILADEGTHCIHEPTIKDLCGALSGAVKEEVNA